MSYTSRSFCDETRSHQRIIEIHKSQVKQYSRLDRVLSQSRVSAHTTSNVTPVNQQKNKKQERDLQHIHISSSQKKTPQLHPDRHSQKITTSQFELKRRNEKQPEPQKNSQRKKVVSREQLNELKKLYNRKV